MPGPGAGYRAVRDAAGVALRTDRARFRLHGRDPARMLNGLITGDLLGAPEGRGVYAAMLTPKGRMIADLRAFRREGPEVLVAVDAAAREGVAGQLRKFVPPMFARWEDVTDAVAEIGVYGPGAAAVLAPILGDAPLPASEDATIEAEHDGARVLVVATREAGLEPGFDCFVDATAAPALHAALLASAWPVGLDELEVLRVEAGRPRYGADLTDEIIPTEAFAESGLMERAVSFTKGCYTGQEVIIRIAHRGHVNRHLRGLLLADGPLPEPGAALHHPETAREVGRVTSVADSPAMGRAIALGYVRREVAVGGEVAVGAPDGPRAIVSGLPFGRGDRDVG